MIELHLIGYTEDREHLVLDLEVGGDGRYTVRIDPDLLATVEQLRSDRVARGAPVDLRAAPVTDADQVTPSTAPAATVVDGDADDADATPEPGVDDTDPHGQPPVVPPPLPPHRRSAVATRDDTTHNGVRRTDPVRAAATRPRRPVARVGTGEGRAPSDRLPSDGLPSDEPRASVRHPEVALDELDEDVQDRDEDVQDREETADEATAAEDAAAEDTAVGGTGDVDAPGDVDEPGDADEVGAAEIASVARTGFRPAAEAVPRARLSPAEIQQRLRSGRSPRAVAKEAGTDLAWIERWLAPIEAERDRVLADARSRRLDVPRARPLGAAVDRALADRNVAADRVVWSVARRDDGRWRVTVRFEERSRPRTATWLLDPDADRVQAASPLATELASPARTRRRG